MCRTDHGIGYSSGEQAELLEFHPALTPDADVYLYVHVPVADPGASLPPLYVVEVSLMRDVGLPRGVKTRTPLQCPSWSLNRLGPTESPNRSKARHCGR
jgi:hypothetical protein